MGKGKPLLEMVELEFVKVEGDPSIDNRVTVHLSNKTAEQMPIYIELPIEGRKFDEELFSKPLRAEVEVRGENEMSVREVYAGNIRVYNATKK
jgi:hypothetical protein